MTEKGRTSHIYSYAICLLSAMAAVVCIIVGINRLPDHVDPLYAREAPEIISTSFEDWRTSFLAKKPIRDGISDSTVDGDVLASTPSDSTLKGIYDALKAQALDSQRIASESHRVLQLIPTLQLAFLAILAIIVCAIQWSRLRGMSGRLLPALIPIFCGCVLPTVAFYVAQLQHDYVPGQDRCIDAALVRAAHLLPLLTVGTVSGFLGLAAFLFLFRQRLTKEFLWLTSLAGTGIMTAIVLGTHPEMCDPLYRVGDAQYGLWVLFFSFYSLIAAAIISALAWTAQRIRLKRLAAKGGPIGSGGAG